ncbi:ABC-2 family transporter protein [Solwaraspora sp. WMMD792]|uniref:ABC transporter permease n=1 Tax=Solwaraspora sp. WMMD792 TaxID=3016099 RepID=UPI002416D62F|nr:ABC-2 family transporter protein [Solwaraspora sp. WMMD792]MDG4772020.1 ABC-2 family transporter protein [Solwaraspora sp. WMMD792]
MTTVAADTGAPARATPSTGVRPYRALARVAARSAVAYPLSFVLGMAGVLLQLLAMLSIWAVLLGSGTSVGGFSWPQMKAYLLIAYVTGSLMSFGDWEMAARIRDGMVAVDLTRPVDYQRARFAETLGVAVVEVAFALAVCAVVLAVTGPVPVPPPGQAALFAVSALLVLPLRFTTVYLTALLCFWTQNIFGVSLARGAITNLFSGALVPLTLLPGWLQAIAAVLPFAGMTFTPATIYLGQATGSDAWLLIGIQAVWTVALWWGARLAWRSAVRQLTVHGG